jgi:hypothetical protein
MNNDSYFITKGLLLETIDASSKAITLCETMKQKFPKKFSIKLLQNNNFRDKDHFVSVCISCEKAYEQFAIDIAKSIDSKLQFEHTERKQLLVVSY